MAKVASGKQVACRSKEEKEWHRMQQPTNDGTGNSKGSMGEASGSRRKKEEQ
jgi:hypothetical protein